MGRTPTRPTDAFNLALHIRQSARDGGGWNISSELWPCLPCQAAEPITDDGCPSLRPSPRGQGSQPAVVPRPQGLRIGLACAYMRPWRPV